MAEGLRYDWGEGAFEGATQEQTGYLSSMARNRMMILTTIIENVFEPEEIGNGE